MGKQYSPEATGRRNLFAGGLAVTLAGASIIQAWAQTGETALTTPEKARQRLIDGNARYVTMLLKKSASG